MPTFRTATVTEVLSSRPGLQRMAVRMADGADARAYATTELVGECAAGDRVVLNTTAVDLGLGLVRVQEIHHTLEEVFQQGADA